MDQEAKYWHDKWKDAIQHNLMLQEILKGAKENDNGKGQRLLRHAPTRFKDTTRKA